MNVKTMFPTGGLIVGARARIRVKLEGGRRINRVNVAVATPRHVVHPSLKGQTQPVAFEAYNADTPGILHTTL
jgi:hypothetical protein